MLTIVVFVLLSGVATAQVPLEIDFGMRGGMLVQNAYQTNPFCCRYFPTPPGYLAPSSSLSFQNGHATFGPAIGALLYDRVEVRFEAVYKRFGYRTQSDLTAININQHSVATTTGRSWEFPFLATYRFSRGTVR